MKKIEAIIRPEKLDDVLKAIESTGYSGVMITEIKGHGKQKGMVQQWRGGEYRVPFLSKMKLEIVAKNADVEKIKAAIAVAARTGEVGDGKLFVYDIADAYKIRTGETGDSAI
jgi:nitrogen regulatory protein P-II 1